MKGYLVFLIVFLFTGCSVTEILREDSTCKAKIELECDCRCEDADKQSFNKITNITDIEE